jgi:hypothetical protein
LRGKAQFQSWFCTKLKTYKCRRSYLERICDGLTCGWISLSPRAQRGNAQGEFKKFRGSKVLAGYGTQKQVMVPRPRVLKSTPTSPSESVPNERVSSLRTWGGNGELPPLILGGGRKDGISRWCESQ